ncbi:type II secretion system protein N [Marinospirillum minutulum]|uniref:type II secretion system protein N n=1 Tax=Marinospirillum minutulum TaxID=64974 RepID=UPI00041FAF6B|nr:type II secretion system protein N [Marinospirillum minutulum]
MSGISLIKKLRTFLLGVLFLLLFSWVFLVTFIALAPVEWLLLQTVAQTTAQAKQPQMTWQKIEGTLAKGSAERINLPGISLEDVSWNLPIWRLALALPQLNLSLGDENLAKNGAWQLQASLTPWGSLSARLKAGDLALLRSNGLPWALEGVLAGELNLQAKLQGQMLSCQSLTGSWQGDLAVLQPMPLDLGQVFLQPSCPDSQTLDWKLTAKQTGEHQITLEGQAELANRRWSFSGQAKLEEQAQLRPALQMLGWRRNNQGEFQGRGSGRF